MLRTTPELRKTFATLHRKGYNKSFIAKLFDTTRQTVDRWCKRAFHRGRESFRDKPREPKEGKITQTVELTILHLRILFDWGTERIKKGLFSLPQFMQKVLPDCVQGVELSRTSINNVLKKHKLNGYKKQNKGWKFFHAKKPDELWQLDIKGPFTVQGKKYWFIVCIDDYSRYLLTLEQLDHDPGTQDIMNILLPLFKRRKPEKILTDNGKQFKESWKKFLKKHGVEPLFAHPYYPQDKGKVERTKRNIAEEFVNLLKKFPQWLGGQIKEYRVWYNQERIHRGIGTRPAKLYGGVTLDI